MSRQQRRAQQMPNMQQMMSQVQRMQSEMAEAQERLKSQTVEASAGGGMVTVKLSGELELLEVKIDPDAVDPEDVEILADMVTAAVNEGLRAARELQEKAMGGATAGLDLGGLGLPGMPGL